MQALRSLHELRLLWSSYFRESKPFDYRLNALSAVEALLWLSLGIEVGIYPDREADCLAEFYRDELENGIAILRNQIGASIFFPPETDIVFNGFLRGDSPSELRYAETVNPKMLQKTATQLLFHELYGAANDPALAEFTLHISFDDDEQWRNLCLSAPTPESASDLSSIYGLFFHSVEHMSARRDLSLACDEVATANMAASSLRRRIRALHNWRINLRDQRVERRFSALTTMIGQAVDSELSSDGLDYGLFIKRVEEICSDWTRTDFLIDRYYLRAARA